MTSEKEHFHSLKKEIVVKLLKHYPSSSAKLEDWKGKEIANFQSHLEESVNGRVSEKWIYTHLKGTGDKIPRKDMLDLLSAYVDVENWDSFIKKQERISQEKFTAKKKTFLWIGIFITASFGVFFFPRKKECVICFVDSERQALVLNSPIQFYLLNENESPSLVMVDSNACARFSTTEDQIKFIIKSPYYKGDTTIRNLVNIGGLFEEEIRLKTDDYALMIHIFSSSKIQDWRRRRMQLDNMIADNAQIYQIFEQDNIIMDLYNKWDFINKLTTPTRSLQNIQVMETQYFNNKIQVMRFKQIEK
jgi:hypothetical protein